MILTANAMIVVGSPASPYTRKLLAALRYRRIPYRFVQARSALAQALPAPRVPLLPTVYLPEGDGPPLPLTDSTPLLRRLEEVGGRSIIPPDPASRFLCEVIEDYADEWLTKPMFHYRWSGAPDVDKASRVIPAMGAADRTNAELNAESAAFAARQIARLGFVGSNAATGPVIEAAFLRFVDVFDRLLAERPFLFGAGPTAADFAIFGQLTQLCGFDPTPAALSLARSARVTAWTATVEDLSGLEPGDPPFGAFADLAPSLAPLLTQIGRTYAPVMHANAEALRQGAAEVHATVDGRPWVQAPFPYQAKTLGWLRAAYEALPADAKAALEAPLRDAGLHALLAA